MRGAHTLIHAPSATYDISVHAVLHVGVLLRARVSCRLCVVCCCAVVVPLAPGDVAPLVGVSVSSFVSSLVWIDW